MLAVLGISIAVAAVGAGALYIVYGSARPPVAPRPSVQKPPSAAAAVQALPSDHEFAEPDSAVAKSGSVEPGEIPLPLAAARKLVRAGNGPFADTRRHPRTEFLGTAAATIYPIDSRQNSEPKQCVIDTRDLSCSGIGIGYTQQLYPTQMIVISALGKLLVAEIRWCHRVDSNYYIAGCRLVKTVT